MGAGSGPSGGSSPRDDTALPTFVYPAPGGAAILNPHDAASPVIAGGVMGTRPPPGPSDHGTLQVIDDHPPDSEICPFLRAVDGTERLLAPIEAPDPGNRCAALRDPVPQSLRQQELVCLASGHVNCPRYLRGVVVVAKPPIPVVRPGPSMSPAIVGSLLVLVMAASASLAFVMAGGGLELTAANPKVSPFASNRDVAQAAATPTPTPVAAAGPSLSVSSSPTSPATPASSPDPSPTPTPTRTPPPSATPRPTPRTTPRPAATSDRYALLRPCPNSSRCWIYRVRAGDNLFSIANYFGVTQDSIYSRNPFVRNGLRAGQELRLPPPTR